jgi:hypothetical protein
MNQGSHSRVVVWLDPTAPQENSLQVLACLGAAVEVLGLFVEDLNLLELSRLPVAREFTFEGPAAKLIDHGNVERQFRAHGMRMRKLFETAVRTFGTDHSFRVTRGELCAELLKVSTDCDTLVLSHSRRQFGQRLTFRTRLGKLLESGPPTLVFVQDQWRTGQRVAVLFDGSAQSDAALRTAASIAGSERLELSVWIPDVAEADRRQLQARVSDVLHGGATRLSYRSLTASKVDELVRAASAENPRVLVLPNIGPAETRQLIAELLDRVNCSLIVAR